MKNKIEIFKNKALIKHANKFDYSLVFFKNIKDYISIICPEHGVFKQRVDVHLKGDGCKKCYLTKRGIIDRLTQNEFLLKAKEMHGETYNYDATIYIKHNEVLDIICKTHGSFKQQAQSHLNGAGCPICRESKGERNIREFLLENNIKFIRQHKFPNCRNMRPLPFDFYLPQNNICIEYHGIQHYEPVKYFGGNNRFINQEINDRIKLNYCIDNNINLIIVKYNENHYDSLNNFFVKK